MKHRVSLHVVAIVLLFIGKTLHATSPKNHQTYKCVEGNYCRRTNEPIVTIDPDKLRSKNEHTSLESCRLVCGNTAGLWPIPTGTTNYGKNYVRIDPLQINSVMRDMPINAKSFLTEVFAIFISNLQLTCGARCERINSTMNVLINGVSDNTVLDWNTDESYQLHVVAKENNVQVSIMASTIYGARHAFETLSQLIVSVITPNGGKGLVVVERANISDSPFFSHRGLLIDTARNYLPIVDILRTIDALGSTKMNVLHWHATDSQSFPLRIKSRPSMALYGAYNPTMTYSPEELSNVAHYAKFRGVRVILEIDSPSHAGAGWEWGPLEGLGHLAVCVNRQPWRDYCIQPPCGQLNPVNSNTYDVLRDIYREVLDAIGKNSVLHLGGDEVHMNCWNSTPEIIYAMASRGMGRTTNDFMKLWGELHEKQRMILDDITDEKNNTIILWSSELTNPDVITQYFDNNRFVIQTWVPATSSIPDELLKLGYRIIISTKNAWYLDHGFWGGTPYHSWRDAYDNRIPRNEGVLGGEACMWGEYVNAGGLDTKVWPRAAAVAERLWSDPLDMTTIDAEPRLQSHRTRLEVRNINADALTPEWCNQHERMCI